MLIRTLAIATAFSAAAASAFADQGGNPPWFPSLMAFEHYDSARTHLFEQARFGGSFYSNNQVTVRTSSATYPTGYNMVYLNPYDVFLYGGGYGNIMTGSGAAIGAFVAKVNPVTLQPIWSNQLINTAETGEWDYPGVLSLLNNGLLYVIYGYRLAELNPITGNIIGKPMELPTGEALPENTSYNGFDALPNGILIAKTTYRQEGCTIQGPSALFMCKDPTDVPASILVSINPRTLQVRDQVTLPSFVSGRVTTAHFQGHDYVYLAEAPPTPQQPPTTQSAIRYLVGTDIGDQTPAANTTDDVVWRDAQTGDELARAQDLPAITLGTMVQPYYFGKIFYPGYNEGQLLELTVRKQ